MITDSEAHVSSRCRRMVSTEVYCDVTDLVLEVDVLFSFTEDAGVCNQCLAVSKWLYFKLAEYKQHTVQHGNLYLWARESTTDDILYMDPIIQVIVNKILVDYEKL